MRFSYLGPWMLERLKASFTVTKENLGDDARLKKGPFAFETESYRVEQLGHFCILRMKALFGLMKMETVVLAVTERDLPLINLDRVSVMGKETQIAELYDTQLQPWPEERQAAFRKILDQNADLPEQGAKAPHWYDVILYPCSCQKAGKGIAARLDDLARDYASAFLAQMAAAPPCDATAKKEKVEHYAKTLFSEGGPAVDMVSKLFGRETAERLILRHMYGV